MCFASVADAAGYNCPTYRKYTSCNSGYYISECDSIQSNWQTGVSVNPNNLTAGNSCKICPSGYTCSGLLSCPRSSEVTITYNLNGGSGTKPANKICYKGQTCPLNSGNTNSFYRAGYQFVGWATSSTATSGFVIFTPNTISNTMTVYAVWKACPRATYKNSSANASAACSACPDGYNIGGTAQTSINGCMMYVNDGQYLAERYSSTTEPCPAGYACPANGINYGTISEEKPQYFYQCTGATFSTGGSAVCFNCPTATAGWVRGEGVGWTNNSSCYQYLRATDISPYCASGELRQYGNRGSVGSGWSDVVMEYNMFKANPGSIVTGSDANMTCTQCGEGEYSAGGDVRACTACPELTPGFEYDTRTGMSSYTQCAQGTIDPSMANPNCMADPDASQVAVIQVAGSATSWGGSVLAVGVVAKPGAILDSQFQNGTLYVEGRYPLRALCTQCGAGEYSPGGDATECTACPALTPGFEYGAGTGLTSYTECKQFAHDPSEVNPYCMDNASTIVQEAGSSIAWDGSTLAVGVSAAPGAILDSQFQDGVLGIEGAYDFDNMCIPCTGNTYSAGGTATSCTSCNRDYTISGTALTDHDSASDCKIYCDGGSYIAVANATQCSNVGAGYWAPSSTISQGSVGSRNACASGLTTIGSGAGADEAGDCGRVLNVGDEKIYLRSTKKTTPSLNISINGDVFYGNMSTATKGSLRINSGGTTYSVYDDSM